MASGARAAPGLVTPSLVLGGSLWHASLYGLVARFRVPCVHVPLLSCRGIRGALLRVEHKRRGGERVVAPWTRAALGLVTPGPGLGRWSLEAREPVRGGHTVLRALRACPSPLVRE